MKTYTFFDVKAYLNLNERVDNWLNPHQLLCSYSLSENPLNIYITQRAKKQLKQSSEKLYVEMQLLYSCLLKKRTVFHSGTEYSFEPVNDQINICYRAVLAQRCDPEEFARHYPEKQTFDPTSFPQALFLDFKNSAWQGYFEF